MFRAPLQPSMVSSSSIHEDGGAKRDRLCPEPLFTESLRGVNRAAVRDRP